MNNQFSNEINFISLLKTMWVKKNRIIVITILFTLFGVIYSFTRPIIYSSYSTFIINNNNLSNSNSLSGVASLVGINLSSGNQSNLQIQPSLYPKITNSSLPVLGQLSPAVE